MADKAEERDILTEILTGDQETVVEGLDSLYEIIRLESDEAPAAHDAPPKKSLPEADQKKTETSKRPGKAKRKAGHYLTETVFEELDSAKVDLRDILPDMPKIKLTKSNIVNIALKTILDEYKKKGFESTLIKKLLSAKKKR